MKKNIVFAICLWFSFSTGLLAQDYKMNKADEPKKSDTRYCASLKDGRMTMMQDKKAFTTDVTLDNSTVIQTDGTVIKNDGSKIVLKNGDCIDSNGNLVNQKSNENIKEEKSKLKE